MNSNYNLLIIFTIFSLVSQSLKKGGNNSEYVAPLEFCGIFLRDFSEVFIPAPINQTLTPPLKKPDETEFDENSLTHCKIVIYVSLSLQSESYKVN